MDNEDRSLDDYISMVCLERTMGDIVRTRENPEGQNAKAYFIASLFFSAVFEQDISIIDTIIKRLDGLIPDRSKREQYANLFGDALDDVMAMRIDEYMNVQPTDSPIIAMAKATYALSISSPKDPSGKRDRHQAVELIIGRTSGRVTEPKKPLLEEKFVEPDWMSDARK